MYLSPCFTTVPEKVWLSPGAAALAADPVLAPDSGALASGVCEPGAVALGVCCEAGGISGDGVGWVCGVCCDGAVSGDDGVCCDWLLGVDGDVWAWSALPQEIIPTAIATVARNERY